LARWQRGEPDVIEAMKFWAGLTLEFRQAMTDGDLPAMHRLINANFDKRASLYNVGEGNRDLVETARRTGASAKFAGSGGAIVGIYDGEEMFQRLTEIFTPKGVRVIKPDLAPELEHPHR
jgi:glucuronokinase